MADWTGREQAGMDLVRRFFDAWETDLRGAYEGYLADDIVYENSGLPTFTSLADTIDFFFVRRQLNAATGQNHLDEIVRIVADVDHIAAAGDMVFTERTDHHYDATGRDVLTPKIAGVMKIADGRIAEWRDYFDPAAFSAKPAA